MGIKRSSENRDKQPDENGHGPPSDSIEGSGWIVEDDLIQHNRRRDEVGDGGLPGHGQEDTGPDDGDMLE